MEGVLQETDEDCFVVRSHSCEDLGTFQYLLQKYLVPLADQEVKCLACQCYTEVSRRQVQHWVLTFYLLLGQI